ncbi:hypothetical protein CV102_10135 [Natronococcus pandeyae]|uniref:Histidine kinase n=1 Tax=Natronococcus pandeyae TaxID=2055836 RepID=A0A8J8TQU1_9EURY|nr:hypothetical protein [Natronococcus pandeyae]TYL38858.1 hypothetical protein CV102_10135 [Natronococcus pandeyae]
MSTQSETASGYGFGGRLNWLFGGAIGGLAGSLLFGGLLWVVDPEIVIETIPAIYGFDPAQTVGWTFHLLHGLVLGVVFGFLVTRRPILGTITADTQIGFLARSGPLVRLALAGFVYGLAVWALLPVIAATVWAAVGGIADPGFPAMAFEGLVGHLLYGTLLGALFAVFVDIESDAERTDAPFDDADESA